MKGWLESESGLATCVISSDIVLGEEKVWACKCLTDVEGSNNGEVKDLHAMQAVEKADVEKGTSPLAKIVNYCEELI